MDFTLKAIGAFESRLGGHGHNLRPIGFKWGSTEGVTVAARPLDRYSRSERPEFDSARWGDVKAMLSDVKHGIKAVRLAYLDFSATMASGFTGILFGIAMSSPHGRRTKVAAALHWPHADDYESSP